MNGKDRLVELLTDRALVGLGQREQIELAELLVKEQDLDAGAFDKAASAVALAALGPQHEALPAGLAAAIEESALAQFEDAARPSTDYRKTREMPPDALTLQAPAPVTVKAPPQYQATMPLVGSAPPPAMPAPQQPPVSNAPASYTPTYAPPPPAVVAPSNVVTLPRSRASNLVAVSGWIAAAACLALAIGAFYIRRPQPVVVVAPSPVPTPSVVEPPPVPPPVVPETAADLRKKLLSVAGTLRAEWSTTKDPAGKAASGEVVWNKEQQRGTMTFRGLGRNDATHTQYQLWIFDKNRDDKYPVDGGVFDIDADTGDVTVPIKAAVPVTNATLFAVTIEKAGGVVVSKREHLVLTAKL